MDPGKDLATMSMKAHWPELLPHQEVVLKHMTMDCGKEWASLFNTDFPTSKVWSGTMPMKPKGLFSIQPDFDQRILYADVQGERTFRKLNCVQLSDQELFDRAAGILLTQGRRGSDPTGRSAVYRSPQGPECIVGHFIPEEFYDSSMEGKLVAEIGVDQDLFSGETVIVLRRNAITSSLDFDPSDMQVRMLFQIQRLHDQMPVHHWPSALIKLAEGFRLDDLVVRETPFQIKEGYRRSARIESLPEMSKLTEAFSGFSKAANLAAHYIGKSANLFILDELSDVDFYDDGILLTHGGKKQPDYTKMASYMPVTEELIGTEPSMKIRDGVWFGEKLLETS